MQHPLPRLLQALMLAVLVLLPLRASADDLGTLRNLASAGDAEAQLLLGLAYLRGDGNLAPDASLAAHWLDRSAVAGNAYARDRMADLYETGLGVPASEALESDWRLLAALAGNAHAQFELGRHRLTRMNGPAAHDRADDWLLAASLHGSREADTLLATTPSPRRLGSEASIRAFPELDWLIAKTRGALGEIEARSHAPDITLRKLAADGDAEARDRLVRVAAASSASTSGQGAVPADVETDALAVLVSTSMVLAYYLFLWRKVRVDPTYTIHGVNQLARRLWVLNVMKNPAKDVMAVQTLRNFIMGASLMASTATLLIIGTLTLSGQADSISRNWQVLNLHGSHAPELWVVKVLALLVTFIVAFFAFAMCVRLTNHVLFMMNIAEQDAHHELAPDKVAMRLNRAGSLFAIGMRSFFVAIPLAFWLFGPAFLLLSSGGLVFALYRLDRSRVGPRT